MNQNKKVEKPYKNQIVQFIGGPHDYIGEIDTAPHKMGPGWWRVLNPCQVFQHKNPQTQSMQLVVASLWGDGEAFKKYVDIYLPPDFAIEIRTVNKKGQLYKVYIKEVERAPREKRADGSNLIEVPSFGPGVPQN